MMGSGYCKISFPNQIQFISNTFMEVHFLKGKSEHICFSKPRLTRQKVLIGLKKLLMGKGEKEEEGSFDVNLEIVIAQ